MVLGNTAQSAVEWLQSRADSSPLVMMTLASIGFLTVVSYPISFLKMLLTFTPLARFASISLSRLTQNRSRADRGGPPAWAIVTGPTGGIGREFAVQLAKAGFSVLLVGRNDTKLATLAAEIGAQFPGVLVERHAIDLGAASEEDWGAFADTLARLAEQASIAVVVNNAGISHAGPVPFEATPLSELNAIPTVNVLAPLRLTQIALPHMLKHRTGLILNVGSFSALVPTPLLATYAGSKAFLQTWSQALGTELEPKGINVRLLNTYFVASEMSKIRKSSFMVPTPRQYVQDVLSRLGLAGGATGKPFVSTSYLGHALVEWALERVGSPMFWLRYNLKMQQSIMRRVERKKAAGKKQEERDRKVD